MATLSSVTSFADRDPLTPTHLNNKLNSLVSNIVAINASVTSSDVNVKTYGALGNGGDDTASILSCYNTVKSLYPGGATLYFPAGDYGMTSTLTLGNAFRVRGEGKDVSRILMLEVSANSRCAIRWTSGDGSQVLNVGASGIGIYAADTLYFKIGMDIEDCTGGIWDDIYIYGGGTGSPSAPYFSGSSSIGIRTRGRDTCSFSNLQIYANRPISIASNPNTAATDCEDADHFRFTNAYLVPLNHPAIEVDAGLGITECEFDGYHAWVGGTAGFKMNDTRVAPVVPSRGISFKNVRREQSQDTTAYAIDVTAVQHVQQMRIERVLCATGSHGIKVDGCLNLSLNNVTTAVTSASTALWVKGAIGGCVVTMESCYWQSTSAGFGLDNYLPVVVSSWETGTSVGPQNAVYAVTRNDTAIKSALVQTSSGSSSAPTFGFTSEVSLGLYRSEASVVAQSYGALSVKGLRSNITTVIGNYTCTSHDQVVSVNSASTVTVTLPNPSTVTGQWYDIQRHGSQTVVILATSGASLNNNSTMTLTTQFQSLTFQSYGTGYLTK